MRVLSPRVVNIEDLRRLARRRLPKVVFDYVDGGAEGEVTLRENRRAFDALTFRPRHAVGLPAAALRTSVLDTAVAALSETDVKNGLTRLHGGRLLATIPCRPPLLARPGWRASFLFDGGVPRLANVVLPAVGPMPLVDVTSALARAAIAWDDL